MSQKNIVLTRTVGIFLVLLSSCLLISYIILGLVAVQLYTVEARELEFWTWSRVTKRVLISLFLLVSIVYGVGLIESRKVLTLYLRRFRKNIGVIDPSDRGGLGRQIRLVTLQDHMFPAFSLTNREKFMLIAVPVFLLVLTFSLSNILNSAALPVVSDDNEPFWRTNIQYSHYIAWLAVSVLLLTFFHLIRVRFRSLIRVSRPSDIESAKTAISTLRSWWRQPSVLGVRSSIIQTNDANWKATVGSLLDCAQVVILDITELTESVLWELKEINVRNVEAVLIGNKAAMDTFLGVGSSDIPHAELITVSAKRFPFLEYSGNPAESLKAFRIELRNLLCDLSNQSARRVQGVALRLSDILLTTVSYALMAVLAGIVSAAFVYFSSDAITDVLRIWMPT